jgi:hypothetical protein
MIEIQKYFEKLVDLSQNDWEIFSSKLIERNFSKNSIIIKLGQKENYLSFYRKRCYSFFYST